MHNLEFDAIRVVEEERVIAQHVVVLPRRRFDRHAVLPRPVVAFVDNLTRRSLEGDVMDADPVWIVDTATGRVLRQVGDVYAEEFYWLRGEGITRRSPALVVNASFGCFSGGVPGGVCGDEVDVAWTNDPRLYPGGTEGCPRTSKPRCVPLCRHRT